MLGGQIWQATENARGKLVAPWRRCLDSALRLSCAASGLSLPSGSLQRPAETPVREVSCRCRVFGGGLAPFEKDTLIPLGLSTSILTGPVMGRPPSRAIRAGPGTVGPAPGDWLALCALLALCGGLLPGPETAVLGC
jgi:hypothetical protein